MKPQFWRSPDVMALDTFGKLLYIGLWNFSDDDGRGLYDPTVIAADILLGEYAADPVGVTAAVDAAFQAYVSRGMVSLYEVAGRMYYQINAWHEHQRVNRPVPSKIPAPDQGEPVIHGVLTESSMSAHRGSDDSSVKAHGVVNEGSMREKEGEAIHGALNESSLLIETTGKGETPDPETQPADSLSELAARYALEPKAPGVYGTPDDPRCETHAGLNATEVPNCHRCARAREWFTKNSQTARAEAKTKRRAQIDACDLCDDNGMRSIPGGVARCNHQPEISDDLPPWEQAQ